MHQEHNNEFGPAPVPISRTFANVELPPIALSEGDWEMVRCDNPHCSYVFCEKRGEHPHKGLRFRCPKCRSWKVV